MTPSASHDSSDRAGLAARLDALLANDDASTPAAMFGGASDDLWLWTNTEGYRHSAQVRGMLPGLPSEDVQRHWTNRAGDDALEDAFNIYRILRELFERNTGEGADAGDLLDFGCGFGRVIRFFLRDIEHERLVGTDHDVELVEFCRRSNRWTTFERNEAEPPLAFATGQFSWVYAYSVFSHFSEAMHAKWLEELSRIIRPGGVLVLSVRPRAFIEYCGRLRESSPADVAPILRDMFPDTERELERYDGGEYCFSPYDRSNRDAWWGEACVSPAYIDRVWSRRFEVREIVEAGAELKQHCVAMQARAPSSSSETEGRR